METTYHRISRVLVGILALASLWIAVPHEYVHGKALQEGLMGWELEKNDWLLINVAENTLQFVRGDYSDVSDKVIVGSGKKTGQKMNYLGMSYNPATPEKVWEIRSKHQQNWFNVFGSRESKEQLFLRLYEVKGEQRVWSHYGIHTTPDIETIFEQDAGYGSWGCVLARYDLLKTIEELFHLNGEKVKVITTSQDSEQLLSVLESF